MYFRECRGFKEGKGCYMKLTEKEHKILMMLIEMGFKFFDTIEYVVIDGDIFNSNDLSNLVDKLGIEETDSTII